MHNRVLATDWHDVLELLSLHGISAVPFKGVILTAATYGSLALRTVGDLDVFVHMQDVTRVRRVLFAEGYRQRWPAFDMTTAQETAHLDGAHEYLFYHPDRLGSVEMQWNFPLRYFSLDTACLWEQLESAIVLETRVHSFSQESTLLVLCVDGCKERWTRLWRICDVAELIRSAAGMDWMGVLERARSSGSERIVLLGLILVHDLLGAPLPAEVLSRIEADAKVKALAGRVYCQLTLGSRNL